MDVEIASNIRFAVENSLISTMKHIGKCEFDQEFYPDTEIVSFRLDGSESLNPHHCYGSIFFYEGNKSYCEDANIFFGCHMNLIQHHSLQNITVNIKRSNGNTTEAHIKKDTPIRYWDVKDCLAVTVYFPDKDGEELYKLIGLTDYYSNTKNEMMTGLLTTNPELKDKPILINVKKGHRLFEIEQQIWRNKMEGLLENSSIKYEFSED
jgi:hypothetical protein